ncbi:MAG: methyltransferase type 11 [Epsilonproteobacteria bacterium (ex Lamellibrachia satsuma)]|nr:MAG: methyltransferase type 11 [Epsilonproteobacteria bacterium (ex Lamellibrachia satsuma)]
MARIDQKTFYQNNYDTFGISACGVAWDSEQTQKRRFSVITSCLGDVKNDTLVDAGCGFGDFYLYLKEKNNLPKTYTGMDLCEPMVKEAQVRTDCQIVQRDILRQPIPVADWYVASGSMNLLTRIETSLFIQRCFAKSRKGFIFNLLQGKEREGTYNYWLPHEIIKLCRPLSAKIQIKEGYMDGDFTVVLLP